MEKMRKEENLIVNSDKIKRKSFKILIIMMIFTVILILIYLSISMWNKVTIQEILSMTLIVMLGQPIIALLSQSEVIPLLISVILAISSSISICKVFILKDNKKIHKSFKKLKKKAIVMLIYDCIVCLWLATKGFPVGYSNSYDNTVGMMEGILYFVTAYSYSIFNIVFTGILCLSMNIDKKEDEINIVE